jgi:hypothetical protein
MSCLWLSLYRLIINNDTRCSGKVDIPRYVMNPHAMVPYLEVYVRASPLSVQYSCLGFLDIIRMVLLISYKNFGSYKSFTQ